MKRQYPSDGVDPNDPIVTTCRQCKKGFKTKNRRQRYCSNKCRDYYNNHKGVKSRYKKDDPYKKNLEIAERVCKEGKQARIEFERLMEFGFDLGLPSKVIQAEDGRIWRVHEGYCYSRERESTYMLVVGGVDRIPKPEGRGMFSLLTVKV